MEKEIEKIVFKLGTELKGRLDDDFVDNALDYINYNEIPLTLDLLCEQVIEDNVRITEKELKTIDNLTNILNINKYSSLKELVNKKNGI